MLAECNFKLQTESFNSYIDGSGISISQKIKYLRFKTKDASDHPKVLMTIFRTNITTVTLKGSLNSTYKMLSSEKKFNVHCLVN